MPGSLPAIPGNGSGAGSSCDQVGAGFRGAGRPDLGLSRTQRLRDSASFQAVFEQGPPVVGRYMVMWRRGTDGAALRLGVISSKRTLRRAVDRARAKRLLREAWRLNRYHFNPGRDVILIARRPLAGVGLAVVAEELRRLARKGGLMS